MIDDPRTPEDTVDADLRALRTERARSLPTMVDTARLLRTSAGRNPGGWIMRRFGDFRYRPWLPPVLGTAAVAILLLFVPVSFQRTVAHQATLALTAPNLAQDQIDKIAEEFRGLLKVDRVSVLAAPEGRVSLTARVPVRTRVSVPRVAQAFAAGLNAKGIPAQARVLAQKEKVMGNLYALAMNNIIEVNVSRDGRTDQQLADEIRNQLESAGVQAAEVQVHTEGDHTQLQVMVQMACDSTSSPACPDLRVRVDGHEPGEGENQKQVRVKVKRTDGMTDDEVIADVKRQLQEQGEDADVVMENGRIRVIRR
jgi:hypothetical protein